jgi:hypothetical protein
MAWQLYRPPSPDAEAANSLSKYQAGLRAAESRDRSEINLDTEPAAARRFNAGRLAKVIFLLAVGVVAMAGVATWFLDRVVAAEIVAAFTAIVIFTALSRVRPASGGEAAP